MAQAALWTPEEAGPIAATVKAMPDQTLTWDQYQSKLETRLALLIKSEPRAKQILVSALKEGGESQLAAEIQWMDLSQVPMTLIRSSENLMSRMGLSWEGQTPPLTQAPAADLTWFNQVTLETWAEEALM